MKWDYAILATGKTHFSNVKTNRINNKIAFGTKFKVENKCRLTIISKVLERIIRKQVSSFIDKKGFLNSTQHGFRSSRSCLSALLNAFDDIMHMLHGSSSVDMVYLDFSKAIDKVDHGIPLHKLKALGITGNLGMWFYNFLTNRSHFVRLPGGISADSPVLSELHTVECL